MKWLHPAPQSWVAITVGGLPLRVSYVVEDIDPEDGDARWVLDLVQFDGGWASALEALRDDLYADAQQALEALQKKHEAAEVQAWWDSVAAERAAEARAA